MSCYKPPEDNHEENAVVTLGCSEPQSCYVFFPLRKKDHCIYRILKVDRVALKVHLNNYDHAG